DRSPARKQDTVLRPVHIAAPLYIAGADCDIPALVFTGVIKPDQILGIMREIGIHLEYERIIATHSPFKPMDIRRPKSQLALALFQEELTGISLLQLPHDIGRTIR